MRAIAVSTHCVGSATEDDTHTLLHQIVLSEVCGAARRAVSLRCRDAHTHIQTHKSCTLLETGDIWGLDIQ